MKKKWISGLGLMEKWNIYPTSLLECMKSAGLQAYHPKSKQRMCYQFGAFAGKEYVVMEGRGRILRVDYYSEAQVLAMLPDLHFPLQRIGAIGNELDRDEGFQTSARTSYQ
jgi:hypothetical protein